MSFKKILLSVLLLQSFEGHCRVQVIFPVKRKALDMLLNKINEENKSILFAVFMFTHPEVALALVNRHKKGVVVKGVIDCASKFKTNYQGDFLQEKCIDIRLYKGEPGSYMHNKYVVFGDSEVWTGSANWTKAGLEETHYENIVAITEESKVVEKFERNFYEMYQEFKQKNKKR